MDKGSYFSGQLTKISVIGLCVGLCLLLDIALDSLEIKTPYLTLMPAIVGACAIGGFGAALWAIFFSSLGLLYFFILPMGSALPIYCDLAHLGVFIGIALFACWIIDGLKRTNAQLSRDNVVLGCKISVLLNRIKAQ